MSVVRCRRGRLLLLVAGVFAVGTAPASAAGGQFLDDDRSVHEGYIEALWAAGLTSGCDPPASTRYCPDEPVTRGQVAAFLDRSRLLPATNRDWFTDDDGHLFEGSIDRLRAADVTSGCAALRFCPDATITRGQLAKLLARAYELPAATGDERDRFDDDDRSPFEADIDRLAAAGVTTGCGGSRFCPGEPVTRAQFASFLGRAEGLTPRPPVSPVERTVTYEVRSFGGPRYSSLAALRERAAQALGDGRGWSLGGRLRFERVDDGGDFTLYLTDHRDVGERAPVCSDAYSCTVGDRIHVNDRNFASRPDPWRRRSQVDYQQYVVLHEVGHWLGFDRTAEGDNHYNHGRWCRDGAAPVMMQQSISTRGCATNVWPLAFELDCVEDAWLDRDVDQGASCPHRDPRR